MIYTCGRHLQRATDAELLARVRLRELVLRAADDFRIMVDERGLAFHLAFPSATVWADADGTRLVGTRAGLNTVSGMLARVVGRVGGEAAVRSSAVYAVSTHMAAGASVRAEVREALDGRSAGADALPSLARTRRVIDEGLRLYPRRG